MYKMPDMPLYEIVDILKEVSGATLTTYHMVEDECVLVDLKCSTILDEIYLIEKLGLKEVEKWMEI